jgi:hypothetical protein
MVDLRSGQEMRHLPCKLMLDSGREMYAVPTIHDPATGSVVGDSSKILDYLENTYTATSFARFAWADQASGASTTIRHGSSYARINITSL